jgi:phosphoglycerate kinase
VLAAHLGRPKNREPELSLKPAAERLEELLGTPVRLAPAVVGPEVERLAEAPRRRRGADARERPLREGETKNDSELARAYARLAEIYVNDAFGAAHRAHASTEGIAHLHLASRGRPAARARGQRPAGHPRPNPSARWSP